MKKIFFFIAILLVLDGCTKSLNIFNLNLSKTDLKPTIWEKKDALKPCLPDNVPVKIYVEDKRPKIETEKVPSSDYIYSGALFNLKNNAKDIAEDLSNMALKFGGATSYEIVKTVPKKGPAIILILNDWYSKIPKKQENSAFITVYGSFAGTIIIKNNDKIIASHKFQEEGLPTIVSTYIRSEKEKQETPNLIWNAMLAKANSAQQSAYLVVFDFLKKNWSKLQT